MLIESEIEKEYPNEEPHMKHTLANWKFVEKLGSCRERAVPMPSKIFKKQSKNSFSPIFRPIFVRVIKTRSSRKICGNGTLVSGCLNNSVY